MAKRPGAVTMKGSPLTLVGNDVEVGQSAPDFTVVSNDLEELSLSSYAGKVCIIVSVPSLDTPVCDRETRHFNEQASSLGEGVEVLVVSGGYPGGRDDNGRGGQEGEKRGRGQPDAEAETVRACSFHGFHPYPQSSLTSNI